MVEDSPNPFQKIWRGQYSLAITFWIFFVVGFLIVTSVFGRLLWPTFASAPYWWFVAIIQMLYGITVGICVWRNADKYAGPKFWAHAAKIAVGLWFGASLWRLGASMPIAN